MFDSHWSALVNVYCYMASQAVPPTLQLLCLETLANKMGGLAELILLPRNVHHILDLHELGHGQLRWGNKHLPYCISVIPRRHVTAYQRVRVRIRKLKSRNAVVMGKLCIRCHNEWDYK